MKTLCRIAFLAALTIAFAAPQANAIMVDLTSVGASGSIGAAYFEQIDPQSTGTGVIDPFVRIQASGTERGFNTDYRPFGPDLADVNTSAQFTKSILVSSFGVVDQGGTPSIRFLLDVNQTSANPLISLDEMKVYVADSPTINTNLQLMMQGTLLYDMDAGGDNWVKMDYSLNSGSGSGDMFAYLPANLFSGYENKYLYLYSKFGVNYATNDGFEEWARIDAAGTPPPPVIPEPATLLLIGSGLAGAAAMRRRRQR